MWCSPMRLATWNCCAGPLVKKLAALRRLDADVVVVPECPRLPALSPRELWFGTNPNKGLAVIASSRFELSPIEIAPDIPRYVIPIQVRGPRPFLLIAVWAQKADVDT